MNDAPELLPDELADDPAPTADALERLHATLKALVNLLNDATCVPGRYDESAAGLLAEADYYALARAQMVVHRLKLWRQYPSVSPESYFTKTGEVAS